MYSHINQIRAGGKNPELLYKITLQIKRKGERDRIFFLLFFPSFSSYLLVVARGDEPALVTCHFVLFVVIAISPSCHCVTTTILLVFYSFKLQL